MSTLTIQPDPTAGTDTQIENFGALANDNYGITTSLSVGSNGSGILIRSLIKFDLSSIPTNAVILSSTLSLYCFSRDTATAYNVSVYKALTQWFEGLKNGAVPGAGENGSTWNVRNANGGVAWSGGAGGGSGTDRGSSAEATTSITATGQFFDWDITSLSKSWLNGTVTNNGLWILGDETPASDTIKVFRSSDYTVDSTQRPKLTVVYQVLQASSAGTSTVTGVLKGTGILQGLSIGSSTVDGRAFSNAIQGVSDGVSTVSGILGASGRGAVTMVGIAAASAVIIGKTHMIGASAGIGALSADGTFTGRLRGTLSGLGILTASGYVLARNIIHAKPCYSDPLLFITDGSLQANNQLNLLNLIDTKIGFLLEDWKPIIAQYKDGGSYSDSPNSTGRNLVKRVFANAIEVFTLSVRGHDEDNLSWYISQLMSWQEAAADYWTSDNPFLPVYIGAKSAKETNIRYAVVKAMSSPQLDNPYAQPFISKSGIAVIDKFSLRLERGDWMSNPPGQSECVAISSQRSWTIAGWSGP